MEPLRRIDQNELHVGTRTRTFRFQDQPYEYVLIHAVPASKLETRLRDRVYLLCKTIAELGYAMRSNSVSVDTVRRQIHDMTMNTLLTEAMATEKLNQFIFHCAVAGVGIVRR